MTGGRLAETNVAGAPTAEDLAYAQVVDDDDYEGVESEMPTATTFSRVPGEDLDYTPLQAPSATAAEAERSYQPLQFGKGAPVADQTPKGAPESSYQNLGPAARRGGPVHAPAVPTRH